MTVDTNIGSTTDLFGKTVDDLQQDIVIGTNAITGTLHYVEDYTGFSSDPAMQEGNFIAIHCNVPGLTADRYSISVSITNPITLDADGIYVGYVANKDSQTITVVASASGYESVTKTYSLSGLTVESA